MGMLTDEKSQFYDMSGVEWARVRLRESFDEIATLNPDLRIEQESNGEFVFMSPTGGESSSRNFEICLQLGVWANQCGGKCFDSSVIFCLPDGSKRSPDAFWIATDRWSALSLVDRKKFPPIAPDFVVELRSESDRLATLQDKMVSYVLNGVRLGWLIDPSTKKIHVYRPGNNPEVLANPETISRGEILPAFVLDLRAIWHAA